jgi:hypothetical protein
MLVLITLKTVHLNGQIVVPGTTILVEDGQELIDRGYARKLTRDETKGVLNDYAKTFEKLMEEKLRELRPCRWCGKTGKWESTFGAITCSHCYPPVRPELVKRWIWGVRDTLMSDNDKCTAKNRKRLMGMDFRNTKKGIRKGLCLESWCCLLDLAERHGWKPQGTVLKTSIEYVKYGGDPDNPEIAQGLWSYAEDKVKNWCGGYTSNEFQWVTEDDARNMTDALERALEERDEEFTWVINGKSGEDYVVLSKSEVEEFASFCRQGEFRIC